MIGSYPADAVDVPRPDRTEMQTLTTSQLEQVVKVMEGDPLHAIYYLAIATGCRRGELVALRWSDVDWSRPAININRTAEAVTVLEAHKGKQAQEKLLTGSECKDQGLVFAKPTGEPLSPGHVSQHFTGLLNRASGKPIIPGHVSQHFAVLLKRAGLPKVRLHDLRHSHATLLLGAGVHPKIVSERLGHSTITLTMDTYSHVLPTMQDEVTKKLETLLPATAARHA